MSRGRRWIVALAVLAACAAATGGYVITRGWPGTASATDSSASGTTSATVPEPVEPTAAAPNSPNPESGQTVASDEPVVVETEAVPVVLTYGAWSAADREVVAGGYVAGVIEDDGVCTLTLTQGGTRVVAEGPAEPDASTTACVGLAVPAAELSAGTWQAVLTYESAAHTGTSSAVTVEVPA